MLKEWYPAQGGSINSTLLTSNGSVTEKQTWREYHSPLTIPQANSAKFYFYVLPGVAILEVNVLPSVS